MDDETAIALAEHLLPRQGELPGDGWAGVDAEEEAETGIPGPELLPDAFPETEVLGAADAHFVRPPAGAAYAMATVFTDREAAVHGFGILADTTFASAFAESVTRAVPEPVEGFELLGPVMEPIGVSVGDHDQTVYHRAVFSAGSPNEVVPITLDLVVMVGGPAVVLLWLTDPLQHLDVVDIRTMAGQISNRLALSTRDL